MLASSLLRGVGVQRILVVDDEQNVLDGLRNLLRGRRHEWDMSFACGGEAALALLEKNAFDVVVTDMRMPRLDGAALLARVKDMQPKAVRIVLSGQTEAHSVMKAVFVAHRFLAKPCEPQLLRNVIERACRLHSMLASPELRAAVGRITVLPSVPGTYLALCRAIARPETAMKDIVTIVERDVGLCAKILQVVNSAFFGLPRRISNLLEATNYLGTVTIKNLAIAVDAFRGDSVRGETVPDQLQRQSLLTAQLAERMLAPDRLRADDAFLAGLLHDIGRLMHIPGRRDAPQFGHPLLGAYLLDLWGLPESVVEAVAHHQDPSRLEHVGFDVVDAVHVAVRLMAHALGLRDDTGLDVAYLADRGVTATRLDEWQGIARQMAAGDPAKATETTPS
jgi:HD-like signal output (HDOD) protein